MCVYTCVEMASWWNKRRTCNGVKGELGSSFERNDSTLLPWTGYYVSWKLPLENFLYYWTPIRLTGFLEMDIYFYSINYRGLIIVLNEEIRNGILLFPSRIDRGLSWIVSKNFNKITIEIIVSCIWIFNLSFIVIRNKNNYTRCVFSFDPCNYPLHVLFQKMFRNETCISRGNVF